MIDKDIFNIFSLEEENEIDFEEKLERCEIETQVRYFYLNELLSSIDEEMSDIENEIICVEVDEEIAEKMMEDGINAKDEMIEANKERVQLQKELEYLDVKYGVVEEMYDEILTEIIEM